MGGDVPWPDRGEIDIMEFVGYNPGMIYANVHTGAYNWVTGTNKGDSIRIEDASTAFHVYAIDWTPERIDFYVDSTRYFSFERETGADFQRWPFDRPQALKLNLAIGGNWGGRQGIDTTIFPQRYYIDYVRYTPFSP
jgi:beta-glucanase (GH16 family)